MQIKAPVTVGAAGNGLTVIAGVVLLHPVAVSVNVKVGLPAATALTIPPLVTVARLLLLLVQIPPVVGDNVVVAPGHKDELPVIATTGGVQLPVAIVKLPVEGAK